MEVDEEDFQEALRELAREVHPSEQPRDTARWLLEEELQADVLAEVERGRGVRLVPLEEDRSTLALTFAFGSVLQETSTSLKQRARH